MFSFVFNFPELEPSKNNIITICFDKCQSKFEVRSFIELIIFWEEGVEHAGELKKKNYF